MLLIVSCFQVTIARKISGFRLKTADSLFITKKYTQSLDHYEQILKQGQYTPAMLLKMAYVHEGLNEIGSAMYYLNLYHIATNDKMVLWKKWMNWPPNTTSKVTNPPIPTAFFHFTSTTARISASRWPL